MYAGRRVRHRRRHRWPTPLIARPSWGSSRSPTGVLTGGRLRRTLSGRRGRGGRCRTRRHGPPRGHSPDRRPSPRDDVDTGLEQRVGQKRGRRTDDDHGRGRRREVDVATRAAVDERRTGDEDDVGVGHRPFGLVGAERRHPNAGGVDTESIGVRSITRTSTSPNFRNAGRKRPTVAIVSTDGSSNAIGSPSRHSRNGADSAFSVATARARSNRSPPSLEADREPAIGSSSSSADAPAEAASGSRRSSSVRGVGDGDLADGGRGRRALVRTRRPRSTPRERHVSRR